MASDAVVVSQSAPATNRGLRRLAAHGIAETRKRPAQPAGRKAGIAGERAAIAWAAPAAIQAPRPGALATAKCASATRRRRGFARRIGS